MTDGGITESNPCSLPAEGGTIISVLNKGMHFHPPCIITLYMPPVFDAVCFHNIRGQRFAVLFVFSGAYL